MSRFFAAEFPALRGASAFLNAETTGQTAPTFRRASIPAAFLYPNDVSVKFGLRLRQLRRERKLTQTRMAKVFGIDRSHISDIERGKGSINLMTLEVIALGFKVSLAELVSGL